jgi:hypothetical protein
MTCLLTPLSPRHRARLIEVARTVPLHRRHSLACELILTAQDIEPEAPALAETLMTIRALLLDCGEGGAA